MYPIIFITAVWLTCVVSASGLGVRTYEPARHDRFTGFPNAPVANPTFLHADLDFSGIGYSVDDPRRQFTLISPTHVAGAYHFRIAPTQRIRFVAPDGTVVERAVGVSHAILNGDDEITDLWIGELEQALPENIRRLPVLSRDTEAAYNAQQLIVTGFNARAGRGFISGFLDFGDDPVTAGAGINTTRTYTFNYASFAGNRDDAFAQSGDSGSPSLALDGGSLALVGTHTAVNVTVATTTTFDTFVPHYFAEVDAVMEARGYHVRRTGSLAPALALTLEAPGGAVAAGGAPFDVVTTVSNTGLVDAHNVELSPTSHALPIVAAAGAGWVGAEPGLRGGVAANTTAPPYIATFTAPARSDGPLIVAASLTADGLSAPLLATLEIDTFLPYAGFTSDDPASDLDHDGLAAALEYALGTAVDVPSLVPFSFAGGTIAFTRRRNGAAVVLETSPSLAPGDWTVVAEGAATVEPATEYGFENVTIIPELGAGPTFFRLRATLD